MSETVDVRTGVVRVRGHLTVRGADLVRGTVAGLHRSGHVRVVVDLLEVSQADEEARDLLGWLQAEVAAHGATLDVLDPG